MVEPDTPLAAAGVEEADDDTAIAMWELAEHILHDQLGLRRYEISNFARPGHECRHNAEIWAGHAFLGAGPSACYFDGETRWTNPADLDSWLAGTPPEPDPLPPETRAVEILITGLRRVDGWSTAAFAATTGYDLMTLRGAALNELATDGLLTVDSHGVRPTRRGLLLANYIARELL
jgi:oxygen-independent coproporphyrinogen-3 oxidase